MVTTLSNSLIHILKPISLIPLLLLLILLLDPVSVCGQNNVLYSPEKLNPGDSLKNGGYSLVMHRGCNLVLYDNSEAIWSSNTNGQGTNCYCTMQRDGNFVLYSSQGNAIWSSGTWQGGSSHYVLVLQNDRNLVIYGPSRWATETNIRGTGVTIVNEMVNSNGANHTMAGQNDTNTKAEPLFSIVE